MANIRFVLVFFFLGASALLLTTCGAFHYEERLNGILVTPGNPTIPVGTTLQFNAIGHFNDESNRDISSQVTWSSSDPTVATIDANGLAKAISTGTATIQATSSIPPTISSGSSGTTILTVSSASLSSLSVSPSNPNLPAGVTQQFTATGTYSDGTSFDLTGQVTWSSSAPSAATITSSGLAIALTPGTTTLSAVFGGASGSTTLTVNSATLSALTVGPANPVITSIPVGVTEQFIATGTYSDGTSFDITNQVSWSSSDPSIGAISNNGLATAIAPGATTLTASSGGISGNTNLTVNSATLSSIVVTPANPSIPVGVAEQFVARGTYSDGTSYDLTTQVTWSLSNPVATVNSGGLATAVSEGTATITASLGSISGGTTLTVSSATLVYISVVFTIPQPSIPVGFSRQLVAMGTYSDGTSYDVTTRVLWSSSNSAAVTVNSNGLATGIAVGTANLRAILGGISGGITVTVTAS
jgi:uncharacterized protein YjdB